METNTSSTSTSSSSHISLSSTLSLPKSCSKHITSKIENLVEYSYIPESAQINESQFPIMSPYNLYKQKTSFTRSIRTLISTKRPLPKEYIQSSRLDQCALQASQSEQYVTMEIPSDLVANWKREGYTHLHLGGVRLILTLYGRKGLLVTARIALLDTRFKEYQHAVVGTVLTTLHAGSVLLTFYPNFNLSLEDPNLPTTLKFQIQLQGAEQTPTSKIATLHHQIKQELLRLMPLEWLTNYEHFHQNLEPVQTTEATFNRGPIGQVKLSFQTPDTEPVSNSPQLSYTAMITTVQTGQEKKLPIHGFSSEGYPVYPDKVNGHFLWDVPEAHMCNPDCPCLDDTDIGEELEIMQRKKKKKKKNLLIHHHLANLFLHILHQIPNLLSIQSDLALCFQVTPMKNPFHHLKNRQTHKLYEAVLNWQTKNANAQNHTLQQLGKKIDRVATQVSQTETKVDSISSRLDQMYIHLQDRISELDADLRRMINNHIWGPEFNIKEAEIRKLKAELSRIDAEKTRPSLFTQSQPKPVSPPFFETYSPFYTPSQPQQPVYNQFFGFSHLQPTPQPSSPKKAQFKIHQNLQSRITQLNSELRTMLAQRYYGQEFDQKEREIRRLKAELDHIKSEKQRPTLFTTSPSIPSIGPTYHPFASMLSPIKQYDPSKLFGMTHTLFRDNPLPPPPKPTPKPKPQPRPITIHHSSISIPGQQSPGYTLASPPAPPPTPLSQPPPQSKDKEPMHQFSAHTADHSLTTDDQTSDSNLAVSDSHTEPDTKSSASTSDQFLGDPSAVFEATRRDYLNMKCCSLNAKDLDFHYKRMSLLFYKLNGFNEPTLKHVFLASLLDELQPDIQRQLTASNLALDNISLGKIFQLAKTCLDKLCEQKQFFKELLKDKEPFWSTCKKPYLQIKCQKKKDCDCSSKKKRHFQKFKKSRIFIQALQIPKALQILQKEVIVIFFQRL
ncbi:hypothetical protein KPL70_014272 [Citrus sinensis]|nr:hypothetical protein KPL70_014272 [Citrus sinensis]